MTICNYKDTTWIKFNHITIRRLIMLGVGDLFPSFKVKATISAEDNLDKAFGEIDNNSYRGKWLVFIFYPKDFTFVCPTEIKGFSDKDSEFKKQNTQVLVGSTDSEFVHHAWRKHEKDLQNLAFPMLADIKRELTVALGILDPKEGVAQRATYIVDPQGVIRFVYVTDLSVGRSPEEVLRVLSALQTGKLCPCAWKPGQKTL